MKNSKKKFKNADGSIRHSINQVHSMVSGHLGKLWGIPLVTHENGVRDLAEQRTDITKPHIQRKQRVQRRVSAGR